MADDVEFYIDKVALDALLQGDDGPVAKDLARRAVRVETAAKHALSQPGRGRTYRRGGVVHVASAPGDPPAVDTGQLRASVMHRVGRDAEGLLADIGSPLPKALWLELGTRRMAARPWLRPALDAARGEEV